MSKLYDIGQHRYARQTKFSYKGFTVINQKTTFNPPSVEKQLGRETVFK